MSPNEDAHSLASARQRSLLDKRAAALRANLKRRKEQSAGRDECETSHTSHLAPDPTDDAMKGSL